MGFVIAILLVVAAILLSGAPLPDPPTGCNEPRSVLVEETNEPPATEPRETCDEPYSLLVTEEGE